MGENYRSTIDLHMHSCYSEDGEFTPAELAKQCAACGIKVMAIADHNCARANEEGQRAARAAGITYIPAIEIDCVFQGRDFHVLGYGIDFRAEDFARIEENVAVQNASASAEMLRKTRALGFAVEETELRALEEGKYWKDCWTGEMFAEVLLARPEYEAHPLLLPYRPGGSRSDNPYVNFYWDFYSQGKPCYVKMEYPALADVVRLIQKNGGKAVLAHPGNNLKGREELLEPILETGMDGLEVYSSYHTPQQAAHYGQIARGKGLLVTCGSDYHGKIKPSILLGGHGAAQETALLEKIAAEFAGNC